MSPHPLVRLALLLAPREFRAEYAEHIGADGGPAAATALDAVRAGIAMRVESIVRDLRLAVRSLAKSPLFTVVVVAAIALAVGANVAVGALVEGVVLRPLPYTDPSRLVFVSLERGATAGTPPSFLVAEDIRDRTRTLENLVIARPESSTLEGRGRPHTLTGRMVEGDYFGVLRAAPLLGRLLTPRDAGTHAIVLGEGMWRRFFAGDPGVLGSLARIDGVPRTIVGVVRGDVRDPIPGGLAHSDYWVPIDRTSPAVLGRGWAGSVTIAHLRAGVSLGSARADLARIMTDLDRRYPQNLLPQYRGDVTPVFDGVVGGVRTLIWMLVAAVGFVLLIACANVANLLLVRAAARERELTLRVALGASRGRLVAQLLTESAVLSAAGGVLGVALAWGLLRAAAPIGEELVPRWNDVGIDGVVAAGALAVMAFVAFATGILPGFLHGRDLSGRLKAVGGSNDRPAMRWLRTTLVLAEITVAVALTIGAGLTLRSFVALTHVAVGFDPANVYDISFGGVPESRYPGADGKTAFLQRATSRLRAVPGVVEVAATGSLPFYSSSSTAFTIPGKPDPHSYAVTYAIGDAYFDALRIPLVRGRAFGPADRTRSLPVAIVSASLARRYFGSLDVLGKTIVPSQWSVGKTPPVRTIVGVAGDVRASFSAAPAAIVYMPATQLLAYWQFVVRTDGRDAGIGAALDRTMAQIDPQMAAPDISSLGAFMAEDALRSRVVASLLASLALIALVLAFAGIYAVTAFSVERRTHEFGIRMAIGAPRAAVLRNVLRSAFATSAAGVVLGLAIAASSSRLVSDLLFGISALDPATFAAVATLGVSTVAAALVPALKATRIEPARALRYE